jgi:hypothetical protein
MPQNVFALLNNVDLKINFNEQDLMTIHAQEQYSSCIQMSTELKMRSLRFLNNMILKINLTKPKSKENVN